MNKDEIARGPLYSVRTFRTGQCRVAGRYAYKTYRRDIDHLFYIYITVIHGSGICALIDTGMTSVEEMNRGAGFLFTELITQDANESTEAILERASVTADEVNYIFFTHCHYDHCSNAILFPNAKIVIPETAWKAWHSD